MPSERPLPPSGLVDIDASIALDLRYATANNFTGAPLPGYLAKRAWLRAVTARALLRADATLRAHGYRIVLLDAYRPLRATRAMVTWARTTGHSNLVGPYIASRSEHNTGAAVDVTLGRMDRTEVDMGTPFDTFGAAARYANASGRPLANRRVLRDVMRTSGFTPYDAEWWHFSIPAPGAVALDAEIR